MELHFTGVAMGPYLSRDLTECIGSCIMQLKYFLLWYTQTSVFVERIAKQVDFPFQKSSCDFSSDLVGFCCAICQTPQCNCNSLVCYWIEPLKTACHRNRLVFNLVLIDQVSRNDETEPQWQIYLHMVD